MTKQAYITCPTCERTVSVIMVGYRITADNYKAAAAARRHKVDGKECEGGIVAVSLLSNMGVRKLSDFYRPEVA